MGQGRQSKAMAKKVRPPLPSYKTTLILYSCYLRVVTPPVVLESSPEVGRFQHTHQDQPPLLEQPKKTTQTTIHLLVPTMIMTIITIMPAVTVAGAVATMMMQPMRHFR